MEKLKAIWQMVVVVVGIVIVGLIFGWVLPFDEPPELSWGVWLPEGYHEVLSQNRDALARLEFERGKEWGQQIELEPYSAMSFVATYVYPEIDGRSVRLVYLGQAQNGAVFRAIKEWQTSDNKIGVFGKYRLRDADIYHAAETSTLYVQTDRNWWGQRLVLTSFLSGFMLAILVAVYFSVAGAIEREFGPDPEEAPAEERRVIEYPHEFKEKVLEAFPDKFSLLSALDHGDEDVGRLLGIESKFLLTPTQIVKDFEEGRQERIQAYAEQCVEAERLLNEWRELATPGELLPEE